VFQKTLSEPGEVHPAIEVEIHMTARCLPHGIEGLAGCADQLQLDQEFFYGV
jgi:hypothetical protein